MVGEEYGRKELAEIWGYRDWHAIGRGVVTPAGDNKVILFVTHEKQETLTQYQDHFEGDRLRMEGETNHANDARLVNAGTAGDEIHLFYHERHHLDFTYFGRVTLAEHTILEDVPSKFTFDTGRTEVMTSNALMTEEMAHGHGEAFLGDEEGKRRYALHVSYERSPRNRAEAIRIHGMKCRCCGFDFNLVYGPEHARDYIEIHHIKSITQSDGIVNPATDLVPLCSNCHSMVHRKRGELMPIADLQAIMREAAARNAMAIL
jgi:5-methylcytosine-specific restriction protein A